MLVFRSRRRDRLVCLTTVFGFSVQVLYSACVGGMTLGGIALRRVVGLPHLLLDGIAEAAYGLMRCKAFQEPH